MDYRKLRYFTVVAKEGSLHKATEKLHLTQPALTRAIQDLEADVDARLFVRHARGVTLTDEGVVLLEHARGLLDGAERAKEAVIAVGEQPRGVVSLGVPPSLSVALLVPLAKRVARELPLVELNMHERMMPDLLEMLQSGRLDAAVVGNPSSFAGLRLDHLFVEDVFLIGTTQRQLPTTIEMRALSEFPLIFPGSGTGKFSWVEEKTHSAGISLSAKMRVETPSLGFALVREGLGFTLLPRSALHFSPCTDAYSISKVNGLTLDRYLATDDNRQLNRASRAVIDRLRLEAVVLAQSADNKRTSQP